MISASDTEPGFRHEAFFYEGADELVAESVRFVRDGLRAGEAVMVALPRAGLERVRSALDGDGEAVSFAEMEEIGRNPGRIISAWHDFLDPRAAAGRPVRGIGEPAWPGRNAEELDECGRHESLLNLAFAGPVPFRLMCPYDRSRLDERVLRRAERNHPALGGERSAERRCAYEPPLTGGSSPFDGVLDPRQSDVLGELAFTQSELIGLRSFVSATAARAGLDRQRTADLTLAASEVAANSVQHGGGGGLISLWLDERGLVCEVADGGRLSDPLIGRVRPRERQPRGRGVWLANQVCDLVQMRCAGAGTRVRLRMRLGPAGR